MEKILNKIAKISSLASRYIGIIIIAFSCVVFFLEGRFCLDDQLHFCIPWGYHVRNGTDHKDGRLPDCFFQT